MVLFAGDYQIWHTFGTWFVDDFDDGLDAVAAALVESGVAEVAHTSDGHVYSRQDDEVKKTTCAVRVSPSGHTAFVECELLGKGLYSSEGVYQFAVMSYRENWLMSGYLHEYAPFVRVLLNPVVIENDEQSVVLYPQVKLYGNGVALLHFRLFAPEDGSDGETLVNFHLNLFQMDVTRLLVPPSILLEYDAATALSSVTSRRHAKNVLEAFKQHIAGHVDRATRMDIEDFSFGLVEVPIDQYIGEEPCTFGFVRELYMQAISHAIAPKRSVFREQGNYWASRPTVFLFDYTRQPEKFREEDEVLNREFASILLRVPNVSPQTAARAHLDNLRLFDDCRWYIGEAVNLLAVSSTYEQSNTDEPDPNHGQLVYDKIVQVEAMEFIRYTHRKMLENAMKSKSSPDETQADWRAVQDMEFVLADPSNVGEVTDTIHHYENVTGLGDIRRRIVQSLEVQSQYATYRKSQSLTALGIVATLVLGLSSLPTLTNEVVIPILGLLGVAACSLSAGMKLLLMLATAVVLFGMAFILWRAVRRRYSR
ncbi:MAG: hypothetical protein WBJ62_09205 [Coriobacteriia bacterium]